MIRQSFFLGMCLTLAACPSDPEPPDTASPEDSEAVCYDSVDNDLDDTFDCLDDGCSQLVTCCVGSAADQCCELSETILSFSAAGCGQSPLSVCVPELTLFGEPGPIVFGDGIAAQESPLASGGYISNQLDVRRARTEIIFEAASTDTCAGDCLHYAALALTEFEPALGLRVHFAPLAVIVRPAFGDIAVMVNGYVLSSWPIIGTGYHRYRLSMSPDGTVGLAEIDSTGAVLDDLMPAYNAELPDSLFVTVMGRRQSLIGDPARIRSVEISRGVCDFPILQAAEPDPVLAGPGSDLESEIPTVEGIGRAINAAQEDTLVIDVGDSFHLLKADATGQYQLTRSLAMPIVEASMLPGVTAMTIDDPWLVADDDGSRWQLYFTVRTATNVSAIGRISGGSGYADSFDYGTFAIVAEPDDAFPRLEMPTVVGDRMIVRAANVGIHIFVRLRPVADGWEAVAGGRVGEGRIHIPNYSDIFAMDSDGISDPALVYDGERDMFRLYFTGTRGTRSRIGLLVSVAGEHWYQPLGNEALWELNEAGFDGLTLRDPAPILVDGQASILYLGSRDGRNFKVGRAASGASTSWP